MKLLKEMNPNELNSELRHAAKNGKINDVMRLLTNGADPYPLDERYENALSLAIRANHRNCINAILNCNAEITNDVGAALLNAATKNNLEPIQRLCEKAKPGVIKDALSWTDKGDTALHIAVKKGNIDMVTLLLAHGADPDKTNKQGMNAFDIARQAGYRDILHALQKHNDRVNVGTAVPNAISSAPAAIIPGKSLYNNPDMISVYDIQKLGSEYIKQRGRVSTFLHRNHNIAYDLCTYDPTPEQKLTIGPRDMWLFLAGRYNQLENHNGSLAEKIRELFNYAFDHKFDVNELPRKISETTVLKNIINNYYSKIASLTKKPVEEATTPVDTSISSQSLYTTLSNVTPGSTSPNSNRSYRSPYADYLSTLDRSKQLLPDVMDILANTLPFPRIPSEEIPLSPSPYADKPVMSTYENTEADTPPLLYPYEIGNEFINPPVVTTEPATVEQSFLEISLPIPSAPYMDNDPMSNFSGSNENDLISFAEEEVVKEKDAETVPTNNPDAKQDVPVETKLNESKNLILFAEEDEKSKEKSLLLLKSIFAPTTELTPVSNTMESTQPGHSILLANS